MVKALVHPTAYVGDGVKLGEGCRIEAYSKIFSGVELSGNVFVDFEAAIFGPTKIGEGTYVGSNCLIGHPRREELGSALKERAGGFSPRRAETVIGKKCVIRSGCIIYSGVKIGDGVEFGHNVLVREDVEIGEGSLVGTNSVIDGRCSIGRGVSIQTGAYISACSKIEDRSFLGPYCILLNDKYAAKKKAKLVGPTIKKGASIGGNAAIMAGVTVGEHSLVGASAVVTKDVPSRSIYVGVPAKLLKRVPEEWVTSFRPRP